MVEVKLSKRAEQVWGLIPSLLAVGAQGEGFMLHQVTMAQQLGCSRWTIGRAIKRLKEAGLLEELQGRHANRCKMYRVVDSSLRGALAPRQSMDCFVAPGERAPRNDDVPTPLGASQLEHCRYVFECNLRDWPDWEKHYAVVTWEFKDITCPHKLWRKTFDRLYVIRHQKTGIPIPVVT